MSAKPAVVRLFSGQIVAVSGLYAEVGPRGAVRRTVHVEAGRRLPPCSFRGSRGFVRVDE